MLLISKKCLTMGSWASILFLFVLNNVVKTEDTQVLSCFELGFAENLLCPTCTKIESIVADEELSEDCRRCCTEPPEVENTKYSRAVLEVGKQTVKFYTEISGFITNHRKKFKNLKLKYTFRSRPQLLMFENKDDEEPSEVISISRWKESSIIGFLEEKLLDSEKDKSDQKSPEQEETKGLEES
mmetsp:Transcript_34044/g.42946  ORF Transcript_34044/g.42946 Transcript_34044/m.42946 type:complete len:184 (+) Transcript_34044:70-621(+)